MVGVPLPVSGSQPECLSGAARLVTYARPNGIVRENVRDWAKKVKRHDFLDFEKKR